MRRQTIQTPQPATRAAGAGRVPVVGAVCRGAILGSPSGSGEGRGEFQDDEVPGGEVHLSLRASCSKVRR